MLLKNQILAFLFIFFFSFVNSVDHSKFKTCEQSGFCRRNRNLENNILIWKIDHDTVQLTGDHIGVEALLKNDVNNKILKLTLTSVLESGSILRMHINELNSERSRYEALDALNETVVTNKVEFVEKTNQYFKIKFGSSKQFLAIINLAPFKIDVYSGTDLVISGNDQNLFNFEFFRSPPVDSPDVLSDEKTKGMWEETFTSFTDHKPFGPMSVAMDFTFNNFKHVYGIPEHADSFVLRDTKGFSDPYRLYNTDVFEYELNSPMALYGSVPFMLAHSAQRTVGLLWLNPSETWIDIQSKDTGNFLENKNSKLTHWISETGVIDVYFMMGETFKDVMEQNSNLTGKSYLPPYYSIGYHQSRWNYFTQNEVLAVDNRYDEYNIPLDAIWLDVEYTESRLKKYFTWDQISFSDPEKLTSTLNAKGRRLITIIDPHIKKDIGYPIFNEAQQNHYFVKTKDNEDYEGWCWPGASMWPDYTNPSTREWWSKKFQPEFFPGFPGGIVDYWNDMNEPSVFSGPEITMPKDVRHVNGFEHRDVHNIYGYLMTKSTFTGLIKYRPNIRPFILTRSFFVGSQKHCTVWTGDNMSKWTHLKATIPMILSLSVAGVSFSGADVPGFFFDPESNNLVVRWYQAGAFQPFFRAHSHIATKKREPWTFSDEERELMGDAIRLRFNYLPYLYTLFYENSLTGMPVVRPLWAHFEREEKTFDIEDAFLFGNAFLVHPVTEDNINSIEVYLPGEDKIWLLLQEKKVFSGNQLHNIPVNLSTIPLFQLGGTIVPKRERLRRSGALSLNDSIILDIFLDKNSYAIGNLYKDDGITYYYKNGAFLNTLFKFKNSQLTNEIQNGRLNTKVTIEKIKIYNYLSKPKSIIAYVADRKIHLKFKHENSELIVRKPDLNIDLNWRIVFN